MEARNRQQKFPDAFEEDLERKLWTPRRDRIFVPSNHVKLMSYDIETYAKNTLLYTLNWDEIFAQLTAAPRREVRDRGICDDCMGSDVAGTWLGIERSIVPEFRAQYLEEKRAERQYGSW